MTIAVRYHSRSGNTKKVAETIAKAAGVKAETCSVSLDYPVDILFIGGAVYAGGVDDSLRTFIQSLDKSKVSEAVIFSTAALKPSAYSNIKKLFEEKEIKVSDKEFHCRGQFTVIHRGRPNDADLKMAAEFAEKVVDNIIKK